MGKIVYLAGAFGFPDFEWDKPGYEPYRSKVMDSPAEKRGFEILALFEKDVEVAGFETRNPWTDTVPAWAIAGVMFGEGMGADGSLIAGTMSEKKLREYIHLAGGIPHVNLSEYDLHRAESFAELEEIYRNMIGDAVYRGNKRHIEDANACIFGFYPYRGRGIDDGTLWEFCHAQRCGKKSVVLYDPDANIGEEIFGAKNVFNMMVSGNINDDRIPLVTTLPAALDALKALA
ncbi:MAG: hypothetical protein NUW37_09595 [Planctomycetes bacterium]|nr:hypothetical protein [Planctomycetota bacterium]